LQQLGVNQLPQPGKIVYGLTLITR